MPWSSSRVYFARYDVGHPGRRRRAIAAVYVLRFIGVGPGCIDSAEGVGIKRVTMRALGIAELG